QPPGVELERLARLLREDVVERDVPMIGEAVLQLDAQGGGGRVESAVLGRLDVVPELQFKITLRLGHVLVGADQRAPGGARRGGEEQGGEESVESDCDSHSQ